MESSERLNARLDALLADQLDEDPWVGEPRIREALASQWRLAQHVGEGKAGHRRQHARNLEDIAKTEDRVRADHAGRYPIELLQNAQDACADAGRKGTAWFRVTDSALLVANEGVPFTAKRIESLIRLGATTKAPGAADHHTIGYKGIGFTSVLEISSRPQIISRTCAFGLDRELVVARLSEMLGLPVSRAPVRYFPFPITPDEWEEDADEVEELMEAGAATVVRLPLRPGDGPTGVESNIQDTLTSTTLLLMPALNRLDLGGNQSWTRRRGRKIAGGQLHHLRSGEGEIRSWLVADRRVPVSSEVIGALEDELWKDVDSLHVLAAIPWEDGRPAPEATSDSRVHAYFPTDDRLGRALLMHGDFFLESNRRRVQGHKAGGAVSDVVVDGGVGLVAEMATAFARAFPDRLPSFLACIAKRDQPQGFGERLAERLDEELARTPMVRTISGSLLIPGETALLGAMGPGRHAGELVRMLGSVGNLAEPDIELAAGEWLRELGASELSSSFIVSRLDPEKASSYDHALLAVASWWRAKPRGWNERRALDRARVLQDASGHYRSAEDLCEPEPGLPLLPRGLEKASYQAPRNEEAAAFVEADIGVERLTPDHAMDLVLDALTDGSYGRDDVECQATHDFALAIFRAHPDAVASRRDRGLVPVPVRSWRRGPQARWRRASEVYFSRDWTGSADLEGLYRRFSEHEFLAAEPPAGRRRLAALRRFYSVVGVADEPRRIELSGSLRYAPSGWTRLDDVQRAARCPDGHPQTRRDFESDVLDRLPDLLEDIQVREAAALVRALDRMVHPLGPRASVWCTHSGHPSNRRRQRVVGIQSWLLETRPWVPVEGDPRGRNLVCPSEAWVDVNGKNLKACLPQALVPAATAAKLGLPSATRADPASLARALISLEQVYPELDDAPPAAIGGAGLLVQRLQAALHRQKGRRYEGPRPPFPAEKARVPAWSNLPAVPDIGLPDGLPITVLPPGNWADVQAVFELPGASELVSISTEVTDAAPAQLDVLRPSHLPGLAALLAAKGEDLRAIAGPLGRLGIHRCERIRTTFRIASGEEFSKEQVVHLERQSDETGRVYIVERLEKDGLTELARQLAGYLGCPGAAETVLLFLAFGQDLLSVQGIDEVALDEATEAISRYVDLNEQPKGSVATGPGPSSTKPPGKRSDQAEVQGATGGPVSGDDAQRPTAPGGPPIQTAFGPPASADGDGLRRPIGADTRLQFEKRDGDPVAPRGRRPSGARGGTGQSGAPSVSSALRKEVELAAVAIARKWAAEQWKCVEVRDVQDQNRGWDLEAVLPSGEWRPVEVKGFAHGVSSFILTRNELQAARENEDYVILLVTGIQRAVGDVITLTKPCSWIDQCQLEPMSWAVLDWQTRVGSIAQWTAGPERWNRPTEIDGPG